MTLVSMVDNTVMFLVLILSFDQVRKVYFFERPLASVVFVLLGVGSFGKVIHSLSGSSPPWWAVCLHVAFALILLRALGTDPNIFRFQSLFERRYPRNPDQAAAGAGRRQPRHPSD